MKVEKTSGLWLHPQYMILAGRIRQKAIRFPRRERYLMREALRRAGIRYKEVCAVTTDYTGFREDHDRSVQFLDFACYKDGVFFIILFHPLTGMHGLKPYEKRSHEAKKKLLEDKGVPYMVTKRNKTSQIFQIEVTLFVRKIKRDKPKLIGGMNEQEATGDTKEGNDRGSPAGNTRPG